ncbi:cysteine desulfurase family protein [Nocardioides sp.]|uniref:cysteine desulfurase family protein n=1 Tax=Nocardioides sp. TaxID=35761 RepID=UPI003D13A53E
MTKASEAGPGSIGGYFDAASSQPLHPAARDVFAAALDKGYADPRRLHHPARSARLLLDNAREVLASCLEVRPDEVTFTTSGTDAVHRGLLGLAHGQVRRGHRVVHSSVEHSAVLHALQWTKVEDHLALEVDRFGRVSAPETIRAAALPGVAAVALQAANHELGTLQPVTEVAAGLDGVPLFVDACALAGHTDLPSGWSTAALSAHKWGGPSGVGVLLVRKGTRWRNPFPGDDRIDERTSGYENVPAALAAAAALQAVVAERSEVSARLHALVERIRTVVQREIPDVEVVGHPEDRLPHLLTFSCLYVDGEVLVNELDRHGFSVASGSACTASTLAPSHVLAAMGVLTHGNLRVSLTRETTSAQVEEFLRVLPGIVARIRSEAGL